jgi:hypothetical protein
MKGKDKEIAKLKRFIYSKDFFTTPTTQQPATEQSTSSVAHSPVPTHPTTYAHQPAMAQSTAFGQHLHQQHAAVAFDNTTVIEQQLQHQQQQPYAPLPYQPVYGLPTQGFPQGPVLPPQSFTDVLIEMRVHFPIEQWEKFTTKPPTFTHPSAPTLTFAPKRWYKDTNGVIPYCVTTDESARVYDTTLVRVPEAQLVKERAAHEKKRKRSQTRKGGG